MNQEQRQAIITAFERLNAVTLELRDLVFADVLQQGDGKPPDKLICCSPVTGKIETGANIFGGDWFDATGYNVRYGAYGHYHTGADLNRKNYADSNAPVYAAADGEIVYSGAIPSWQGLVVCVRHRLESGQMIWTRYAHIKDTLGLGLVKRGQVIGRIADYLPAGVVGDHLHFDVATIDLGSHPGDWPGTDSARVARDYLNPFIFLRQRSK